MTADSNKHRETVAHKNRLREQLTRLREQLTRRAETAARAAADSDKSDPFAYARAYSRVINGIEDKQLGH